MRQFNLRAMLALTLFTALALACVQAFRGQPRRYLQLDQILSQHTFDKSMTGASWEIHVLPEDIGPFRTAGADWSATASFQFPTGMAAHGFVDTGSQRRRYDHEGIPGVSFRVVPLEDKDDRATYLILKRAVRQE